MPTPLPNNQRLRHALVVLPCAAAVLAVVVTLAAAAPPLLDSRTRLKVSFTGAGMLISVPRGIACPPKCSASFRRGSVVAVKAAAETDFDFSHWRGVCVGRLPACFVSLDGPRNATAVFIAQPAPLNVTVGGRGRVESIPPKIDCGEANEVCSVEFEKRANIQLFPRAAPAVFLLAGGAPAPALSPAV